MSWRLMDSVGWWIAALGLFATLLAAGWWWLSRRQPPLPGGSAAEPLIRIDMLDSSEPSAAQITLDVYHQPMRLAGMVLAPSGRGSALPPADELSALLEHLAPGFPLVVHQHQPRFARWPAQLSVQGFMRSFFREVELPGNHGKGTPWSAIAGRFEADGQTVLVGLICRGRSANSLGQIVIQQPTQWLDILRIHEKHAG